MELIEKLPYQYVRDSPTVKYYTDWRKFNDILVAPKATRILTPPIEVGNGLRIVLGVNDYLVTGNNNRVIVEGLVEGFESLVRIESRIQAIHFARLMSGVRITIPPNTVINEPVVIVSPAGNGFLAHHVVLDIGANSRIKLFLLDYSRGNPKTIIVEGKVAEDSNVEFYTILLHGSAPIYHYKKILVSGNASIEARILGLAGEMSHYREDYELLGQRGGIELYGSFIAGEGRIDSITNIVHGAAETKSTVLVRGVVLGNGLLVHRGVARVTPRAPWSSTSIDSLVSILSDNGRGYSVPMLEIQTGRVSQARHSTAVMSIEEDQLFYLRSRGLSVEDGKKLLLEGIVGYSGVLEAIGYSVEEILTFLY